MSEIINNTNKTKVKCDLTTCAFNSSCCIVPCETCSDNQCTCDEILINEDEYTGDLQCCQWKWGNKEPQCVNCQLKSNGEISIPIENISLEIIDEDSF